MATLASLRFSIFAALGLATLPGCGDSTGPGGEGQGGGSGGTGSGGGTALPQCLNPVAIEDTGFVRCSDGSIDRVGASTCADPMPPGQACIGDEPPGGCIDDADCIERPYGRCIHYDDDFGGTAYCGCQYGCASDDDCTEGALCLCSGVVPTSSSTCVTAACTSAVDCESGECGLTVWDDGCGPIHTVACRTATDTCRSDADCTDMEDCSPASASSPAGYACQTNQGCAIGRPMTVEGRARVAPREARADWAAETEPMRYPPAVRAALAQRWTDIAALEHASVGSFARFTLQLLSLGAPADLLAAAQRAALDEVEHAKLAYALASAFSGRALGPGSLDGVGAAIPTDEREILRALVAEACIGETLGVAEAIAAAEACTDPAISAVLSRVVSDEQRHAELAWRTLAWMLKRNPALAIEIPAAVDSTADLFVEHDFGVADREAGLLSSRELVAIRRRAFDDIVRPCLSALVAS